MIKKKMAERRTSSGRKQNKPKDSFFKQPTKQTSRPVSTVAETVESSCKLYTLTRGKSKPLLNPKMVN